MNSVLERHGDDSVPPARAGFRLGEHDRITIEGKPYRPIGKSGDNVTLVPANGDGLAEQFPMSALARRSAAGQIKHEVGYFLPDDLKPATEIKDLEFRLADLPAKARERVIVRYAQVMAIDELVREGAIRCNTADIEMVRDTIEERARPYLEKVATGRDLLAHERQQDRLPECAGRGLRNRRGGKRKQCYGSYSADYLRKLHAGYRKYGMSALADNLSASGNKTTQFRPEEQALLIEIIQGSYLTPERKSIKATTVDVRRGFKKENARRAEAGVSPLRIPGRDAVRGAIGKLGRLKVMIARHGHEEAMKKLRPVREGLEVSRPGERVEIDEWCIDLLSIIHSAKLHAVFGTEFLEAIGFDNEKARWWLVLAIDCRTRVILGMKLTRDPCASSARECLRMVVSDKGEWSDAVGALTPWSQAVVPETLVADNGPGFKASSFTDCCLDLRVNVLRTIAGIPGMRGTVERVFHTAGMDLMPRLTGRTFSNPIERGDYKAEDRAVLDAEDVGFALVRWVVDIYHNSPHEGLGGRTPLEQWQADMDCGNYPLRALPDTRDKRIAFGNRFTRTVSREGVTIMGIRYHDQELAKHFIDGQSRQVEIRWDPENLGAIDVQIDGQWVEVKAVQTGFESTNLHVWIKARRALRAKSASRKVWNEETVFRAIDDIEALTRNRSVAFGIADTTLGDKRLEELENSLFSSFEVSSEKRLEADGEAPGREILSRGPDTDLAPGPSTGQRNTGEVNPSPDVAPSATDAPADAPAPGGSRTRTGNPTQKPRKAWLPRNLKEDE